MSKEYFVKFPAMSTIPEIIEAEISGTRELLDLLYHEIGCESVETVRFSHGKDLMIVDEEGLCKENPRISLVGIVLYPGAIVGTVIIAQEGIRDGEPDVLGFDTRNHAEAAAAAAQTVTEMKYGRHGGAV